MKCYTCGEIGHMSWECPKNKPTAQRNVNITKAREESSEEESLMLKRVLVKTEKKVHEATQRKSMFRNKCKSQGKCCKMVIGSGSTDNLVSIDMV